METDKKTSKIHPLAAAAAIAIIVTCLAGIAAMLGILPNFNKNATQLAPTDTLSAAASEVAPTVAAANSPAISETPAPAEKSVQKLSAKKPATVPTPAPAYPDDQISSTYSPPAAPPCRNCGVVESVRTIEQQAPTSGVGAGIGAVLGGVLGNQVGHGSGRTLATIAGAVGGGYAGNTIEKNRHTSMSYEVIVRMENGSRQRFMMNQQRWRRGDLVRVKNGNLFPRY